MKVFYSIEEVNIKESPVATIGTFDGVHQGHREVLYNLIDRAKKKNTSSLLITFNPHPRIVLNKGAKDLKLINNPQEKIDLLGEIGIDYLLVIPFTFEFSKTSARLFIENYLISKLNIQALIIGYDHHFGNMDGEKEDIDTLIRSYNINIERIAEKDIKDLAVSSTKIRKAISDGNFELANILLGYKFSFCGTVIHGNKIGRTIGFPTANIMLEYKLKLIPADGVYIVDVIYENMQYQGMLNIGFNPTLNSKERSIEIHILDFDKLIYGSKLYVKVLKKIRDEKLFSNIDNLKIQLEHDKKVAINYFKER